MNQASRSVEVSIAAHYVPQRVQYLALCLDAINSWSIQNVRITLVTNDMALAQDPALLDILSRLKETGRVVQFDHAKDLEHPWHLTWWHKQHLRQWCEQSGPGDLFCYMEDDIALPNAAIEYFSNNLDKAKAQGLIPGFLRYEGGSGSPKISTDFRSRQMVGDDDLVRLNGVLFIPAEYPYWAGFVLDKELAEEYLRSPWAKLDSADEQPQSSGHSCRVQSAWALTYHAIPSGMRSRMAVPVDAQLRPLDECMVWHTPGNYSASRLHGFGTIPVDRIFARPGFKARLANLLLGGLRLRLRIVRKVARLISLSK